MSGSPQLAQVQSNKLLEAVGRTSGLALGVLTTSPAELIYGNAELLELLRAAEVAGGVQQAKWLLDGHPRDGYEVCAVEIGDGLAVVAARLAPGERFEQLIGRMARRYSLSEAEHQELRHMARALTIKGSARELGISPETVRVRRKRVYRKMGLDGHEALLSRLCLEALLLPPAVEAVVPVS